jgi:hypothetical protein
MAIFDSPARLLDTLSAPLGDLIASVGRGVADAQQALDAQTVENFKEIHGAGSEAFKALRELGYQPTWYQIPEATAEIAIALTISGEASAVPGEPSSMVPKASRLRVYGAPVDAGYASRYNYEVRASSTLKFRIVPVPPSTQASGMKIVPNVVGKTYKEARELLQQLGIDYAAEDTATDQAVVTDTQPDAGDIAAPGLAVRLIFKPAGG